MFCGNCGDKSLDGDRYCIRCGREQSSTSASQPLATPVLERPEPARLLPQTKRPIAAVVPEH